MPMAPTTLLSTMRGMPPSSGEAPRSASNPAGPAASAGPPHRRCDRAKVEQAVLIVERWVIGRQRHRTFYSLADVNAAIGDCYVRQMKDSKRYGIGRPL